MVIIADVSWSTPFDLREALSILIDSRQPRGHSPYSLSFDIPNGPELRHLLRDAGQIDGLDHIGNILVGQTGFFCEP